MSRWRPDAWRRARELLLAPGGAWDLDDGTHHAGFADWCRAHPGARCRVWVSSAFVVELAVDAGLPLAGDAELLDWARVQLATRDGGGTALPCAAWQCGARRGVSVLHGLAPGALQADAQRHGVRLAALAPWWSGMLARCRHALPARSGWRLLVVEAARVAAVQAAPGGIGAVETAWLDRADAPALQYWLHAQGAGDGTGTTLVCGYGLAPGALPGWQPWPGLHDDAPHAAWRARAPA